MQMFLLYPAGFLCLKVMITVLRHN